MALRRIAPRAEDRDLASRVTLVEYEAVLAAEANPWVQELQRSDEARLRSGEVRAQLWVLGPGEVAGLAVGDFVPGVGRRLRVYLEPAYRTAEDLGRLLDELEARSEQDGPIATVADLVPGVGEEACRAAFGLRGYFRVERVVLRLPADAPLPEETMAGRPDLRPIGPEDEEGLVSLMRESYDQVAGEPTPWLSYRDPRRDARDAVKEILEGRRGTWLPWASFGFDALGVLKAASLVNRTDVPFLSEVMVAPELRGIGLGYHLTLASVRALRERGMNEPHLFTTSRDLRALRLCRRVGFVPFETRALGVWVKQAVIGAPSPLAP